MSAPPIFCIAEQRLADAFPPVDAALRDPDGLLAAGGDLSCARLLDAYTRGIFPWYSEGQPILWWSPDPRCVLVPSEIHISRRLKRRMRGGDFRFTYDRAFRQTIDSCAAPRASATGTWITAPMRDAYCELHTAGAAHSFECWQADRLVGGIYGVAVGQVFFGESMFSAVTDGSKMCLANLSAKLIEWDYQLIDCQVHNAHLQSLGATLIPRPDFTAMLTSLCAQAPANAAWRENDE